MTINLSQVQAVLRGGLDRVFPAVQVEIRLRNRRLLAAARGWIDPHTRRQPLTPASLFDLASLTKLYTAAALMTLVEEGAVLLDQPASTVLPEFAGLRPIQPYEDPLNPGEMIDMGAAGGQVDAAGVTFRQLLAHTAGLPAWRPLWQQPDAAAARRMALETFFSYPAGSRVVYSDLGLILTGLALERLTGLPLARVIRQRVTGPLGLAHTRYLPLEGPRPLRGVVPTEFCPWRGRRICGEVHDENAWRLGGVAGHAGLFSTAGEVAALGQAFLDGTLLRTETVAEMMRLQAEDALARRGLGFALWSPDPEAAGHPFSPRAYGHTGFTGTSLWVDPERALVVACLTNRVYYGRDAAGIAAFRSALHREIVRAVDRSI